MGLGKVVRINLERGMRSFLGQDLAINWQTAEWIHGEEC
jgi:hypothetical protein